MAICKSTEHLYYFILETILINIPSLIFLGTSYYNYKDIQYLGLNRVTQYSTLFKVKLICASSIVFVNMVAIFVTVVNLQRDGKFLGDQDLVVEDCFESKILRAVFLLSQNFFQVVSWQISYSLMIYSYRKGLSEEWYSQKLFWASSLLLKSTILVIDWKYYCLPKKIMAAAQVVILSVLFVAMLRTVRRDIFLL